MPWKEVSAMSARREFVTLASRPGVNVRELCRRFEISPTTAYKWLGRDMDYADRSRRPHHSPNRTCESVESVLLEIRDAHPQWNARKIRRLGMKELKPGQRMPAASTVGAILKRNGRITDQASAAAHHWQRFEHPAPNDLSQIDFMGHFAVGQKRCYALTMIDDHSRFAQVLAACDNERTETVKAHLIEAFRRYGLPSAINMDNGNPWGNPTGNPYTKLTVWLMRLGVQISHSRPSHPQTNGKDERFHRTIRAELVGQRSFSRFADLQPSFEEWRHVYNYVRPHEALSLEVPASRYEPSCRTYPESLPPVLYNESDVVRVVRQNGMVALWRNDFYVSQAFAGERVALRATTEDGIWGLYFCQKLLRTFDRNDPTTLSPYYRT